MRIARRSADPFLRLLTATTTLWVLGQAFINIGYVIGLLPVTGLQLPLISAGGTSTATTLFMIGIMANAARHEPEAVAALRAGRDDKVNRLLRLPLPEPYVPTRIEALRAIACSPARSRPSRRAGKSDAQARRKPQRTGAQTRRRPIGEVTRAQGIMDLASGTAGQRRQLARSRIGRSALRVNDTVRQPTGGQGNPRPPVPRCRHRSCRSCWPAAAPPATSSPRWPSPTR